jgi:hypothetical protein
MVALLREGFADGFLGSGMMGAIPVIKQRYADWISLFRDINRYAVALQYSLPIQKQDGRLLLAACFYLRTVSNLEAGVILLTRGMAPQSRAMLRVGMESLFALAAITKDPSAARQLVDAHNVQQGKMFHKVQRWSAPELRKRADAEVTEDTLKEIQARISETGAKAQSAESLAKTAGLHDWYLTAYAILSGAVHSSAADIERHVIKAPDGTVQELCNEPEVENLEKEWLLTSEMLLKAISSVSEIFEVKDAEQFIDQQYMRLRELADKV